MSGPKRSSWDIAREQRRAMRRARAVRRESQISEINAGLQDCQNILHQLSIEHGQAAEYVVDRAVNSRR